MAMFRVVWKHAQMHQNTFLTTPDTKKISFSRPCFWWSGSMRKCIKTRFRPLQTLKNIFFPGGLEACANASKHIFINSRRKNIIFFSGGLEACANASKYVFYHSRCANASKHIFINSRRKNIIFFSGGLEA
jgi:hypothetical protein